MTKEHALAFYNKGLKSTKTEEKLFCFYDAFLCLYGNKEGVAKAAESCNVSAEFLKNAISYANADSDCRPAFINDEQLALMQECLQKLLC